MYHRMTGHITDKITDKQILKKTAFNKIYTITSLELAFLAFIFCILASFYLYSLNSLSRLAMVCACVCVCCNDRCRVCLSCTAYIYIVSSRLFINI